MEYRTNFIAWALVDLGWATMDVVSISAIAIFAGGIGPWNPAQIIFMTGLYRLISVVLWGCLYQAFEKVPKMISEGGLDILLVKPVDSQFMVSTSRFAVDMVVSSVVSFVYIAVGAIAGRLQPSLGQVLFGLWLFGCSIVLTYAMYFASVVCALFVDRLNNIHVLFPNMFGATRWPPEIYPPVLQQFLIWILPLALILVVPMQAFYDLVNWNFVIILHVLTIVFLLLGRWLWQTGLKHYSSASS